MSILSIQNLRFAWPGANQSTLNIKSFSIEPGERVLLSDRSGSGKSTLLSAIAGTIEPQRGTLSVCGTDLTELSSTERDRFRSDNIGMIHQLFNLLPFLNALDNVTLPCRFSRRRQKDLDNPRIEARRLLSAMGMDGEQLLSMPVSELSVGQQQRVAAARALIGYPPIILADEPTSALDPVSRDAFLDLVLAECLDAGSTLLFVSHDPGIAGRFDRSIDWMTVNENRSV
ncbi:ABC transporter ATP-binding protein [Pseudophaeobacter flagellatus]|uniref:ABC transporter ATP-binding protein n=1 Tax=Pseudophaeobacter flagellatus TaxID=2899119 RepID=UPI001E4B06CC|nr:ABC transporter ATP-binding protein [Pseudophaeobacter flagellatus]MCD9149271.1 ABC transporter ATP-binding protein [Pseudophaeobacter flagellatus]